MWLILQQNKSLFFLLWLLSPVGFAFAGAGILDLRKFYWLSKRGVHVDGRVTALEPENHNAVEYAYIANGEGYGGSGIASKIRRESENMTIGEAVPIVYDAAEPGSSWLGDPTEEFGSRMHGVMFLAAFPTLSFFVLYLKHRIRLTAAT